ncbi:MAG: cytochrome b/b6 domain-containing protein [Pseudomonadota bacterium]|nr:cytochrome b/b6 domain-containing protein [Pseudomonadota bacterium]
MNITVQFHPIWLRINHWLNAVAFLVLMSSGWRIYDASPFLGFRIPSSLTLGGWLGGALLWHFAAMWLLAANGLAYLLSGIVSGRLRQRLLPIGVTALLSDLRAALSGQLAHERLDHYNQVQRLAYLAVILDLLVLVLSGLVLWKSVQFPLLRTLLGGYEQARRIHFLAMAGGGLFLLLHLLMTALHPRTLLAMLRGH